MGRNALRKLELRPERQDIGSQPTKSRRHMPSNCTISWSFSRFDARSRHFQNYGSVNLMNGRPEIPAGHTGKECPDAATRPIGTWTCGNAWLNVIRLRTEGIRLWSCMIDDAYSKYGAGGCGMLAYLKKHGHYSVKSAAGGTTSIRSNRPTFPIQRERRVVDAKSTHLVPKMRAILDAGP